MNQGEDELLFEKKQLLPLIVKRKIEREIEITVEMPFVSLLENEDNYVSYATEIRVYNEDESSETFSYKIIKVFKNENVE